MKFLFFFPFIVLTTGFPTKEAKPHNTCGGIYSKTQYYEFLESVSYEERNLHSYSGIFGMQISVLADQRDGALAAVRSQDNAFALLVELKNWVLYVETAISSRLLPGCLWTLDDIAHPKEEMTLFLSIDPLGRRLEISSSRNKFTRGRKRTIVDLSHCAPQPIPRFEYLDLGAEWHAGSGDYRHSFLKSFSGCMAIRINGNPVDQASNKTASYAIHECEELQEQCPEPFQSNETHCTCPVNLALRDGRCVPSCDCISCYNGGTCLEAGTGQPSCKYLRGYDGPTCKIETCERILCHNGGTCVMDGTGQPSCECSRGYDGPRCEIDTCREMVCHNGGACVLDGAGHPSCDCAEGYGGPRCEIANDPCKEIVCPSGYVCRENSTLPPRYECICTKGADGVSCVTIPEKYTLQPWLLILICLSLLILISLFAGFMASALLWYFKALVCKRYAGDGSCSKFVKSILHRNSSGQEVHQTGTSNQIGLEIST